MTQDDSGATRSDRAIQQIRAFEQRCPLTIELACLAAFPMALTTELVGCLRENFAPDVPWYGVADILLSGLCEPIGYDLYEMAGAVRRELLKRLRPEQVRAMEAFMLAYIQHRMGVEGDRARILGDRPEWTALACLGQESEVLDQIRSKLRSMVQDADQRERLYIISLMESYGESILAGTPILQWVERFESGMDVDAAAVVERSLGVELRSVQFETAKLYLTDEVEQIDPTLRQGFEFETVWLDRSGRIERRESREAWGFVERLDAVGLEMVAIPGGQFEMGSPPSEPERYDDESPQHSVTVLPFFMGRYPVTQAQWRVVAGWEPVERTLEADPAYYKGDDRPVERVSWEDAREFCARLNRETKLLDGWEYGLPSEAEWEYACRAGTTTAFNFGEMISPEVANYDWDVEYDRVKFKKQKDFEGTTPVGSFPANLWGLYDMHGNVWEWCEDHWHGSYEGAPTDGSSWLDESAESQPYRVIRGGSWIYDPRNCRSASRSYGSAGFGHPYSGFRVVCRLPRTV
jgi:formylglycine-generating enzyme required for sulfatase activity